MFEDSARFACDTRFPGHRVLGLVRSRIAHYNLDLSGLTVLTEAATGYYRVTPIIAAMARADRVLALARSTRFGTVEQAHDQTSYLAELAAVRDRVEIVPSRSGAAFSAADLITNLGAVRPIDGWAIGHLQPTAVVSLMFGGNDWRPSELDLSACRAQGIAVTGVDEAAIDLFRYTGLRLTWFLLELGLEVVGCRLVFVGRGPVFTKVMDFLNRMGAMVLAVSPESKDHVHACGGRKVATNLGEPDAWQALRTADALFTFDPLRERTFIGPEGEITAPQLAQIAPAISVINYSGNVDRTGLGEVGINCFPRSDPGDGHSANTIGEILPAPVIELHSAGLKVGQIMARARLSGLSPREAEQAAIESGLGEDLRDWWIRRLGQDQSTPSPNWAPGETAEAAPL